MSILFIKNNVVPVGGRGVNTHCVFRVVRHGDKLHLRFRVANKDNLKMLGSILEAVQIPGSLQVPDSSAKHRRIDGVTVNPNFCEREQILSATGLFFLTICTIVEYCNISKLKKGNNFRLFFLLLLHKETTTKHSLKM